MGLWRCWGSVGRWCGGDCRSRGFPKLSTCSCPEEQYAIGEGDEGASDGQEGLACWDCSEASG